MSAQQTPSSTPVSLLRDYVATVGADLQRGISTEHTYRPALKALIEAFDPGVIATNEPTRIECGAPDFIVTRRDLPVGYIEAKDIGVSLDEVERSEQLKRYRDGLSNLILTDYLELRWYRDGERVGDARIAYTGHASGKLQLDKDGAAKAAAILSQFLAQEPPIVAKPEELAKRMAALARTIRDVIARALAGDRTSATHLREQLEGFRKVLIHDLSEDQFADMFAQTIAYGLFAARVNVPADQRFTRQHAAYDLPKTNPFLRQMFGQIAGPELDERITWAVDDLAELLARARMDLVLADFGQRTRQEDPVVHFYETFLKAYDPKMREARGVYYTPEPVVSYIVRSVDRILKTEFGLPDGLADNSMIEVPVPGKPEETRKVHKVQILDPACGTGTFLAQVIETIRDTVVAKQGAGMWPGYVHDHLLPRLYGFELLMAPYAIAHLKLGMRLKETGYDIDQSERLQVYLTNALEEAHERAHGQLDFFGTWLAEEADRASEVKRELPIMVILGNPPYSGHSANKGKWISKLLHGEDTTCDEKTGNYFEVDGHPLGERQPKWLNDDYVKFLRFAQWRIERTGSGVAALITNHGYLDNPTFRGMRQSLGLTFDSISVLDLHGNVKKGESSPDGSGDENVFDIQQGVAIGVFVRRPQARGQSEVAFSELWGARSTKYSRLLENDVATTTWDDVPVRSPMYTFRPSTNPHEDEYDRGIQVTDLFETRSIGVQSHRDGFVIAFDRETLVSRVDAYCDSARSDDSIAVAYGLKDSGTWSLSASRRSVSGRADEFVSSVVPCLYRPFDKRWMIYHDAVVERRLHSVIGNMLMPNLCLLVGRQTKEEFAALVANLPVGQHKITSVYDGSYVFPLYVYPEVTGALGSARTPNLSSAATAAFAEEMDTVFIADDPESGSILNPEALLAFVYAVVSAPSYRSRFGSLPCRDFPRIPLTSDRELFRELCRLGSRLVTLHLMEATDLQPITTYPVAGDNRVEKVRYTEPGQGAEAGRVWINPKQHFEGVPSEVWEFHVGGYQVCSKWLKDRKGRLLTYDDLKHYQYVVAALAETIALMREIDEVIEAHGGWPLK